jgi:hypothetical protein
MTFSNSVLVGDEDEGSARRAPARQFAPALGGRRKIASYPFSDVRRVPKALSWGTLRLESLACESGPERILAGSFSEITGGPDTGHRGIAVDAAIRVMVDLPKVIPSRGTP